MRDKYTGRASRPAHTETVKPTSKQTSTVRRPALTIWVDEIGGAHLHYNRDILPEYEQGTSKAVAKFNGGNSRSGKSEGPIAQKDHRHDITKAFRDFRLASDNTVTYANAVDVNTYKRATEQGGFEVLGSKWQDIPCFSKAEAESRLAASQILQSQVPASSYVSDSGLAPSDVDTSEINKEPPDFAQSVPFFKVV
jgi:hypothetical protein